jgi:hypothetical protein
LSEEDRLRLEDLQQRCCQPEVLGRPGFDEIVQVLNGS